MSAADLITKLNGVRETGRGRWLARCPAHDDKRASLSVRELDDGRVLVHCFAECTPYEVLASVGMEMTDLFPGPIDHHRPAERQPFPAMDVLRAVAHEGLIAAVVLAKVARGESLDATTHERATVAVRRLLDAVDLVTPQDSRARARRAAAAELSTIGRAV